MLRKGVSAYFWSLILSVVVFGVFHYIILNTVNDYLGVVTAKGVKPVKGIIALILVAAISTGYGLLNYIVRQEKTREEKQKERLQSELSFLRSQISPHFIFNVLNSIVYLIRSKSNLAETVTLKLSELLRYMLYDSQNLHISLEKELSYVENYIGLQRIRFEEDVDIQFTVTGEPSSQLIEPMLLIPFVENAFKHGIGVVMQPEIIVDAKVTETTLRFEVKNKISPDMTGDKDNSSGIGLKNIQRRLELLYPHQHKLVIRQDDGWFYVTLMLNF
jgi:LytS/YehU family sensor histidine kinase